MSRIGCYVIVFILFAFLRKTAADEVSAPPQTTQASSPGCAWGPQNESDCASPCQWVAQIGHCVDPACNSLTPAATCSARSGCAWSHDKCRDYNVQYGSYACSNLPEAVCASSCVFANGVCSTATNPPPATTNPLPTSGKPPATEPHVTNQGTERQATTASVGTSSPQGTSSSSGNACAWGTQTEAGCSSPCQWVALIAHCVDPSCNSLTTADQCAARSGCAWSHDKCRDYNVQFGIYSCSSLIPEAFCGSSCVYANGACKSNASPVSPPPAPVGGCAWLTQHDPTLCPDRCTYDAGLTFCYDAGCASITNATLCAARSGCAWKATTQQCLDYNIAYGTYLCSASTSRNTCASRCQWSHDTCISGSDTTACAWLNAKNADQCPERCTYNSANGLCYDGTCATKTDNTSCLARGGCAWVYGTCRDYNVAYGNYPCETVTDPLACGGRCQWKPSKTVDGQGSCISGSQGTACAWLKQGNEDTCPDRCTYNADVGLCFNADCATYSPDNCPAALGCAAANGRCRDYNVQYGNYKCAGVHVADQCAGRCQWVNNKCVEGSISTPCAWLKQNQDNCPDRCTWSDGIHTCYDATCASQTDADKCKAQGGCTWTDNQCLDYNIAYGQYRCDGATSQAECHSRCQWNSNTGKCIAGSASTPCAWLKQGDSASCPNRCTFEAATGRCYDPTCSGLSQPDCLAKQGCAFYSNTCFDYNIQYGDVDCSKVPSKNSCGGRCFWSDTDNACERKVYVIAGTGCTADQTAQEIANIQTKCSSAFKAILSPALNANPSTFPQIVSDMCSGECGAALQAAKCSDAVTDARYLCKKKESDQQTQCGVAIAFSGLLGCNTIVSTDGSSIHDACVANSQCGYSEVDNSCYPKPTDAILQHACDPCVRDYLSQKRALLRLAGAPVNTLLIDRFDLLCVRMNDKFCFVNPAFDTSIFLTDRLTSSDVTSFVTAPELDSLCSASVDDQLCFNKVAAAAVSLLQRANNAANDLCVQSSSDDTRKYNCQVQKMKSDNLARMADRLLGDLCTKNDNGDICLGLPLIAATEDPAFAKCWVRATSGIGCGSVCSKKIHDAIANWTCCVGVLQRVLGNLDDSGVAASFRRQLLGFDDNNTVPSEEASGEDTSDSSSNGGPAHVQGDFMYELQMCMDIGASIVTDIENACPKPRGHNTAHKELTLQIPYGAFSANQALSGQVLGTFSGDLAVRLGVSSDSLSGVSLSQSSTEIADPLAAGGQAVGSSRRQSASFATTISFSLQASNDAQTNAASSDFDTQVSSGVLALSSTSGVLESSCASCGSTTSVANNAADLQLDSSSGSPVTSSNPSSTPSTNPSTSPATNPATDMPITPEPSSAAHTTAIALLITIVLLYVGF